LSSSRSKSEVSDARDFCRPPIAFSIVPASWIGIAVGWTAKLGAAASTERDPGINTFARR
jgi:hypothetical protein